MGWTFDVEVLYIARRRGYRIVEVPIDWYFNADSAEGGAIRLCSPICWPSAATPRDCEPPGENY